MLIIAKSDWSLTYEMKDNNTVLISDPMLVNQAQTGRHNTATPLPGKSVGDAFAKTNKTKPNEMELMKVKG